MAKNSPRDGRYYTYLTKDAYGYPRLAAWGLETLSLRDDIVFILEGTFKCVPFHRKGIPAISFLTNDPKMHRNFLSIVSQSRTVICVGDNDAGKTATRSRGYPMAFPPDGFKDTDEMPEEDFDRWIECIIKNL